MAKPGRVGMGFWDRLVLLGAWVVTCGLVYLLGFYVGKGMQEHRLGIEERIVRLPITATPPPAGQRAKPESELTFYDTLGADGRAPRQRPEPPRQTPDKPAPEKPSPERTAVVPVPHPSAAESTPPPPAERSRQSEPKPAPAPGSSRTEPANGAAAPATVAPTPAPPHAGGAWTVLASPTRNREEAEGIQRRLRGLGYDATVIRVLRDNDTWYRVQVGRFATSEQATEVMQRLRERDGVTHVFVASE